ncbi:MAG: hypothetical protein Q9219_007209 [cf. Caloplaca sp. 3 TL-2023]
MTPVNGLPPQAFGGLDHSPTSQDLPPRYEPPAQRTDHYQSLPPEQSRPSRDGTVPPCYSVARYGIYASEEEYLAALRAWVEEKSDVRLDDRTALTGFYGKETMQDYANRPGLRSDRKKKREEKLEAHLERDQSSTMTSDGQIIMNEGGIQRRKSSIGQWFTRHRRAVSKA